MTPITRDDSAPQLTDALVRSNRPVEDVASAIIQKVVDGVKDQQTGQMLPLDDRGRKLIDLYV